MIDVRTHPPLLVAFPLHVAERKQPIHTERGGESDRGDADRLRDIDSLKKPSCMTSSAVLRDSEETTEHVPLSMTSKTGQDRERFPGAISLDPGGKRSASMQDLLDDMRLSTYSPPNRASFPSSSYTSILESQTQASVTRSTAYGEVFDAGVQDDSPSLWSSPKDAMTPRLPNFAFDFDVRTLNLHLAIRITEILGCAEAMWEWVVENQKTWRQREPGRAVSVGGSTVLAPGSVLSGGTFSFTEDKVIEGIAELTRADFDGLLFNFER